MPCGDEADCGRSAASKTELVVSMGHSNHQHETENCSPFCICACCGQNLVNNAYSSTIEIKPTVFARKQVSVYKVFFTSDFYANIWQPPKIG